MPLPTRHISQGAVACHCHVLCAESVHAGLHHQQRRQVAASGDGAGACLPLRRADAEHTRFAWFAHLVRVPSTAAHTRTHTQYAHERTRATRRTPTRAHNVAESCLAPEQRRDGVVKKVEGELAGREER
eukprot:6205906-Pleurochrysis_carterae.AAC.2